MITKRRVKVARQLGSAVVQLRIDHIVFTLQPHDFLALAEDVVKVMQSIEREQAAPDVCRPHAFELSHSQLEYVCGKCGETRQR